ncbi:MAG: beta-ketoacyl-ACP reductase [Acidimicrobiaceae bacterium]|nr:beta-ketoacyl-ACP reductase [Acidimicrobiaceae bacterium]MXW75197.1 beta-ketoacyl-ACP reductase [Acidimicrobiaceae bacterium]MYC42383.1 beta-ketoacyl-ACP reductase [Acidimicrobiaceae bacterium]MYD06278.1 beta-ketoacyl-ACP reductase [Acidimicrobiaceae bacterium]MYI59333.1 beta-ketoacyl-ACP reductase [Acidimicrobiaceae bacterium]
MSRVVLVTGGNRGIGLATARRFQKSGHNVAVTARSGVGDDLEGLFVVKCDVTDKDSVDAAVTEIEESLGPVEILVSNAGITRDGLVLRMNDDDFSEVLDANLTGGFRVARRVVKQMMRARWGRIVFVSSVIGLGGQAGQANYAASKAGITGLARSLAKEFAGRNITVNVVAPGPIDTDMLAALSDAQRDAMLDMVPLGRLGAPQEIAAAIEYLASEDAGFVTGTVLPIDGGLSMG